MINPKIAILAAAITEKLALGGYIAIGQAGDVASIVGELIHAEVYPDKCPDCGTLLCPQCSVHMEAPVDNPKNEFEAYPVCPYCALYVKPDKTMLPIEDFALDSRYVHVSKLFGEGGDSDAPPPKKEWKN